MTALPATSAEAESAFIGALLHLDAVAVIEASALVRADDLEDPRLAVIYSIAIELAANGVRPDPPTVHGFALSQGRVRLSQHPALVGLIVDLYGNVPVPAAVQSYGRTVVELAARRRLATAAERLADAADSSGLDTLIDLVERETAAVLQTFGRLAAAPWAGAA